MAEAFDLDAALAESEPREPFVFSFGGDTYTLPPEPDMVAIAQIVDGDLAPGLRRLFGADQYVMLETSPATFGERAMRKLLEQYAEHAGMDLGEAFASSVPSNRMARRSKPTSNGSTASASATSEQVR